MVGVPLLPVYVHHLMSRSSDAHYCYSLCLPLGFETITTIIIIVIIETHPQDPGKFDQVQTTLP